MTASTTTQPAAARTDRDGRTEMTAAPAREPDPVRQRRRPALIGIGIALLALGPLAGAYIGANTDDSVQVLALSTGKLAGQRLTTADLRAVSLSADPDQVPSVRVEDADQVTGKLLAGNLPAGTLITPQMVGDGPATPQGTFIVGIPVTPGQMPAVGLRPGDQVTLVVGATQGATQQAPGTEDSAARQLVEPGRTWKAEVVNVGSSAEQDVTGAITVDMAIASSEATDVAAAAASRSLSIVLQPAGATVTEDGED